MSSWDPNAKSRLISDEEKRIIAYHEAGHAVVMNAIPEADPVQKITIVGRGQAGGLTWYRPEDDRLLHFPQEDARCDRWLLLGGRVAEELVFDDITSGASNDIEQRYTNGTYDGHPPGHVQRDGPDDVRAKGGIDLPWA